MHTMYLGSDDELHYFFIQNGKVHRRLAVNRDTCTITPSAKPYGTTHQFVHSIEKGKVNLLPPATLEELKDLMDAREDK